MGLDPNVAGLLSYLTMFLCCIGAVVNLVFFLTEKENRFVRFHAMQSLLFLAAGFIVSIATFALAIILAIAHLGALAALIRFPIGLGFMAVLIICAIKAYQGEMYKLPVIGNIAENIAGK